MKKNKIFNHIFIVLISLILFILSILIYESAIDSHLIVGGVIKNDGRGWELIIIDDNHTSIGINHIEQVNKRIIVNFDEVEKVISVEITVDEMMAQEGYTVGASVGTGELHIYIYDTNGALITPSDYNSQTGNI